MTALDAAVTDRTWDLVVVGAGPAGAAAALGALAADPRLDVLLLDRAEFPRDKCCGDGIAPHVRDVLREVGADGVDRGWAPLRTLELARGERSVTGALARPVWVIPREVFDARLVERATAAGAVLARHKVGDVRRTDDLVVLDGQVRARVVVAADGAHSSVRRSLGLGATGRRALAIRGYAPTADRRRGRQVIRYGARRQPSYAWSFDRGDGLANVGYGELVGRDADAPTRTLLLEQLEELLPGTVADGDRWRGHHLPLSGFSWNQPAGPVLLAGDAAGLVNPMTGEGIFYAVATGVRAGRSAARALASGRPADAGQLHRRAVRQLLAGHLRHTWVASRLSARPRVVDAGILAAGRSPRVFDDLVEIGLGDGRITPRLAGGLALGLAGTRSTRSTRATAVPGLPGEGA